MKPILLTVCMLFSFCIAAMAQQRPVLSGKVTDAKTKEPVTGASVYVSNAAIGVITDSNTIANYSIGTVTNQNGEFVFKQPASASGRKLVVSSIGYISQEVELNATGIYQFELVPEKSKDMDEVVVTGYQNIEKKKATGAVGSIKMDAIKQTGVQSVDQMLGGQLAGVAVTPVSGAPGEAAKIRVRGVASINGSQDPLWVIDGIPVDGTDLPKTYELGALFSSSIAGLNTNDIESITVLKDASATAIYGARAANGVIVVNTKNGRKVSRPSVSYNTDITFTQKPDVSRLNLLNANQKVDLELDLFLSGYGYAPERGSVARILNKYSVTKEELAAKGFNGVDANAQKEINALRNSNTDWNDMLFRNTHTQNHNVSVAGGGDGVRYYFSGGFYDEKGVTKGTGAKRYTLTLKTDFDLSKKLKFEVGMFANQRENTTFLAGVNGTPGVIQYSRMANPYTPAYDESGKYFYDNEFIYDGSETIKFNMIEELNNSFHKLLTRSFLSNFKLSYKIINGLTFSSNLGLQKEVGKGEKIALEETYFVRSLKRSRIASGDTKTYLPQGGVQDIYNNDLSQTTWKNMLEYNFNVRERNQFIVMIGNELRAIDYKGLTRRSYGYDPQTLQVTAVTYPSSSAAEDDKNYNTNTFLQNRFASFFSTASYTLDNKYTLTGSLRYDGSDMFGVDPKYRYQPIWSVGGLWRMAAEEFLKNSEVVNTLNLRASYGLQGNIDKTTSKNFVGTRLSRNILPTGSTPVISVQNAPNDKLRWEKTTNINVGLDFGFLNNRLSGSVDLYKRVGKDLLDVALLTLETGFQSQMINWGQVENKGIEWAISTKNVITENFRWITDFNFSYNKNSVIKQQVRDNDAFPSREGLPVNAIFTLPYYGINAANGEILMNKNGAGVSLINYYNLDYAFFDDFGVAYAFTKLKDAELRNLYTYSGTSQPLYTGGMTNTFYYKGFDLSVGLLLSMGHKVMLQPAYNFYMYNRGYNTSNLILNRWTPENKNGAYPGLVSNTPGVVDTIRASAAFASVRPEVYSNLDVWLRNADYIRVRNITLGYTFPASLLKNVKITNLRFLLEARNPFVLMGNYKGYLDPETMGNPYAQPIPKTFALALNVTF